MSNRLGITNADLDSRVATLEESVRGISGQIQSIGISIGGLRDELTRSGRPDWQALIAGATLLMAILAAALIPNYLLATWAGNRAEEALSWQKDYQRGIIPSSADPKLAAVEKMFAEVETQFRAFKERMLENEEITSKTAAFNLNHIEENRHKIEKLEADIAWWKGKTNAKLENNN